MPADPREHLLTERERLASEIALLAEDERTRSTDERGYDNHLADDATDTLEVETDFALERHVRGLLEQVERALERLDGGTYGCCESCGQPIEPERLNVLPHTPHCLACSRRESGRRAGARP